MENLPDTAELQALVAVVDAGSLSGGARELDVPRATLSRRLSRLEEALGVRLIHRSTRSLRLSPAGEELYSHARGILSALRDASDAVQPQDAEPRGLLRVSVPPLNSFAFRQMLLAFVQAYPQVQLEVIATTAHQDLQRDQIDVAWRAGPSLDPGLIARKLMDTGGRAFASPDYLARFGMPQSPEALSAHRCIVGFHRGERPRTTWPLLDGGSVRVTPALACNDLVLTIEATLAGIGIGLLPEALAERAVAEGRLQPVLPEHLGGSSSVSLVFAERQLMKPALRAFLDHAVAWSTERQLGAILEELPT